MGDYRGAAAYIKDALALIVDETGDSGKKDKLYIRLAKCFLHLLEFTPAEEAISSIGNVDLRSELNESVESMKALRAEVSDESALRRQVLDQISRFKPCLYVDPHPCVILPLTGHQDKTWRNITPLVMTI